MTSATRSPSIMAKKSDLLQSQLLYKNTNSHSPLSLTSHSTASHTLNSMFAGEFPSHFPATLPPPIIITAEQHDDHEISSVMMCHHDHLYELVSYYNYSSSGCESSPSYSAAARADETRKPTVRCGGLIQRSASSHSLIPVNHENNANSYPPASLGATRRLVDLPDSCNVRRVFSTGDLQLPMDQHHLVSHNRSSDSPLSGSSSIIEGMLTKACRYSPEEKKERIERYKSKRRQRNFNKKIKYECRKTLADSRPRIRGRFARNNCNEDQDYESWVDLFCAAWST